MTKVRGPRTPLGDAGDDVSSVLFLNSLGQGLDMAGAHAAAAAQDGNAELGEWGERFREFGGAQRGRIGVGNFRSRGKESRHYADRQSLVQEGLNQWEQRLGSGRTGFSASPVAADGKIYFASEDGDIYVVQAGPEFKLLAENPMAEICMSTPAISEGVLFVRTQKHLVAVAE